MAPERFGKRNSSFQKFSTLWPLAHLAVARASAMQGDTAQARKSYQDFFTLWKDADPDIPILIEAKREFERLR